MQIEKEKKASSNTYTLVEEGQDNWTMVHKNGRNKGTRVMQENSTMQVIYQNDFEPLRMLNEPLVI